MYQQHFGLQEPPFLITPRAEIFFAGGKRGATLEALLYAVTRDEGIVKLSGDIGSGKTMLCQALIRWLPPGFVAICPASPPPSREELLYAIADEIGLTFSSERIGRQVRDLSERLSKMQEDDEHAILLLDEAHTLSDEVLEQLRQLSNLESGRRKLLRIVLFGQPDLDQRLLQDELRQFRERLTHNFALEPLTEKEVAAYLTFRMRAAGLVGELPFTDAAVAVLAARSGGFIRRIDVLADKAMQAAHAAKSQLVDRREAKAAVAAAALPPTEKNSRRHLLASIALLCGVAIGIAGLYLVGQNSRPPVTPASANLASIAPFAKDAASAAPEPAAAEPAEPSEPSTASASSSESAPPAAETPGPQPAPPLVANAPLASTLIAASEDWLRTAPGERYFIQLTQADAARPENVENFLQRYAEQLDAGELRAYHSALSGRARIGIIYGDFASSGEASAAIIKLPPAVRATHPYVRTVSKLR